MKTKQPKPPPTPLERFKLVRNRCLSGFNFGRLKTYGDYLTEIGRTWEEGGLAKDLPLNTKEVAKLLDEEQANLLKVPEPIYPSHPSPWYDGSLEQPAKSEFFAKPAMIGRFERMKPEDANIALLTPEQRPTDLLIFKREQPPISPLQQSIIDFQTHPSIKCRLKKKQFEAASALIVAIVEKRYTGNLLQAGVGTGKTYILGYVIAYLKHIKFFKDSLSPWPIVYITKASIVEQTARVLARAFGLNVRTDCPVINIEQLRATFGDMYIDWQTTVIDGEAVVKPVWRQHIHPILFIWDECQVLKNATSLQSQTGQAVNDIENNYKKTVYQIFSSATPFTRVCEAKCFAVSTRIPYDYGVSKGFCLTNGHWTSFAKEVASPFEPEEYSPTAIQQLIERLLPYIVDVKGIRPQFRTYNKVELINFANAQEQDFYNKAWERYQAEKARIEGDDSLSGSESRFNILAQFTKFRECAESIRYEHIADFLVSCWQNGEVGVAACCFKTTIAKVVGCLMQKHGWTRDMISLIWGGVVKKKVVKRKTNKMDSMTDADQDTFRAAADAAGMSQEDIEALFNIEEEIEEKVNQDIDPALRLGNQSKKARQEEIDRFQRGDTRCCIFTFKSGGVGLSLHHCDELTEQKVRLKPESGFAVEEDIPLIPTRPRRTILTPTYSAIEMVQGLGRAPRLTSLSDTTQLIVFYRGTIEERVAYSVSVKLRCLKKVVRQKESWETIVTHYHKDDADTQQTTQQLLPPEEGIPSDAKQIKDSTLAADDDATDLLMGGGSDSNEGDE